MSTLLRCTASGDYLQTGADVRFQTVPGNLKGSQATGKGTAEQQTNLRAEVRAHNLTVLACKPSREAWKALRHHDQLPSVSALAATLGGTPPTLAAQSGTVYSSEPPPEIAPDHTCQQLRAILTTKGIPHNPRARKSTLLALVDGSGNPVPEPTQVTPKPEPPKPVTLHVNSDGLDVLLATYVASRQAVHDAVKLFDHDKRSLLSAIAGAA